MIFSKFCKFLSFLTFFRRVSSFHFEWEVPFIFDWESSGGVARAVACVSKVRLDFSYFNIFTTYNENYTIYLYMFELIYSHSTSLV